MRPVVKIDFISTLKIVSCHAEGEVGDVIIDGVGEILQKMKIFVTMFCANHAVAYFATLIS
jgi:proline racemase